MSRDNKLLILRKSTGLNVNVDPASINYSQEGGVSDLRLAVNVDVSDAGDIELTKTGYTQLFSGSYHSLFRDRGPAFCAKGSDFYLINPNKTLKTLRSDMSGQRISYVEVGPQIFYSDSAIHGVVENGASRDWPETDRDVSKTEKHLRNVPAGRHLEEFAGRIFFTINNVLFWTELNLPGLFAPAENNIAFGSYIRMVKKVEGGLFVSTSMNTWFLPGIEPHSFSQNRVAKAPPAHEWSVMTGHAPGGIALWTCKKGVCKGNPDGNVEFITEEKLAYPETATTGASVLFNNKYVHLIY